MMTEDRINPSWYRRGGIELIDVLEAYDLHNYGHLMQAVQYICRAPFKDQMEEDLLKAVWYLNRQLKLIRGEAEEGGCIYEE